MRGHIVKRYTNSYTIVLNLGKDPSTGKTKQQWISVKGNKKDAEKRLAELLHQLDTGSFVIPGKITLGEFLEQWLKEYVWPNLAPRTAEGYETIVRWHLIPALGNIILTQLKPEHIQKYYSDKLKSKCYNRDKFLNPGTVRHHHMTLHCALQVALKRNLISRNPADAVDPPHRQHSEMNIMNEDDVHLFLEAAKSSPYYSLFYTAIYTGMRRSELLALRWSDVDLLLCQISVIRTLHQIRDGSMVFRQPKTAKGRRTIALSPSATLVLKAHKEVQLAQKIILGIPLKEDSLVFSQIDGKPLKPDLVSQGWQRLAQKVGLRGIHFHSARHSHASLMLKQGVHPKIVQERLGHSSIQITLDTYSHVAPGLQEAAANRFDELLNSVHENRVTEKIG